ncbi:MAG: polysaccharide biosynthesis/export family protein [Microcoleaceae cyanobacterium]
MKQVNSCAELRPFRIGIFRALVVFGAVGTAIPGQAQFLPPPPTPSPAPSSTEVPVPSVFPPVNDGVVNPNGAIPGFPDVGSGNSDAYVLGAGDRLQIDIFNVPEYSGPNGQHQISTDGLLNLPLVGGVPVQGLTLNQAKQAIETQFAEYLQRPMVTLTLLSARPIQVAIAGEVERPGAYTFANLANSPNPTVVGLTPDSASSPLPTLTRLLQMSGGVTSLADIRQVKVRRQRPGAPEQILNLDLWELLQNGDIRQDIPLRDGDMGYVPTVTDVDRVEAQQLATANFASNTTRPISIAIVGEVNRPGTHTLGMTAPADPSTNSQAIPANAGGVGIFTVTRAIRAAGGITPLADIRQIEVRRLSRTGTEQIYGVDLWQLLQEGDLTQDVTLQQGDTIVIPTAKNSDLAQSQDVSMASFSPDTIQVSVVGEVMRPGPVDVPPNTSLNQALTTAGGFNEARAKTEEVELIRLNANGTVSRRAIAVDFSKEVNDQTNPLLQHNDVVVVGRSGSAAFRDGVGGVLGNLNPLNGILGIIRMVF